MDSHQFSSEIIKLALKKFRENMFSKNIRLEIQIKIHRMP